MNFTKIISLVFVALLCIWAVHIFIKIDASESTAVRLLFPASLVIIPLIIGFIFFLFKKKLFHLGLWIGSFLIFAFIFYVTVIYKADDSTFGRETYVAMRYFKDNAGFFTRYNSIIVAYDYPDTIRNTGLHIVKNLYRLGSKKRGNYYIGKVLIDENYKVIKEYYNQRAISDSALLRKEFGKTFEQILFVIEAQDHFP